MILADTNAWFHHLRKGDAKLVEFLTQLRVYTCDVVMGELMLGAGLPKRFIPDLRALPSLPSPTAEETRHFVERHRSAFSANGLGWADAQIMLTAAKAGARLHTSDRYVHKVCSALRLPLA